MTPLLLLALLLLPLPVQAVTYTATFPTQQAGWAPTISFCDALNCEGPLDLSTRASLPRFDPAAGSLQSVQVTYDVRFTATATGYNFTSVPVYSFGFLETMVSLREPVTAAAAVCGLGCPSSTFPVAPGSAVILHSVTEEAAGAVTLGPGDPRFAQFVGSFGTVDLFAVGDAFEHANVSGCIDQQCYIDPRTAPILLSGVLSGTVAVTYAVPVPATLILLLGGLTVTLRRGSIRPTAYRDRG